VCASGIASKSFTGSGQVGRERRFLIALGSSSTFVRLLKRKDLRRVYGENLVN